jgi:hypothetical protein
MIDWLILTYIIGVAFYSGLILSEPGEITNFGAAAALVIAWPLMFLISIYLHVTDD